MFSSEFYPKGLNDIFESFSLPRQRVVCIGMYKTGTTSVEEALEILGYRTIKWKGIKSTGNNELLHPKDYLYLSNDEITKKIAFHHPEVFGALREGSNFGDGPWLHMYKEIHKRHPETKFILTVRDPDEIARSDIGMWKRISGPDALAKYTNEDSFEKAQQLVRSRAVRHVEEVGRYFSKDPSLLLVIDLTTCSDPWNKICSFLGKDVPETAFPHRNRKSS